MGRTQLTTREIGSVQRNDFDTTTSGSAVITKLVAGTNISLSQTGVDTGTGDVTVNLSGTLSTSNLPNFYFGSEFSGTGADNTGNELVLATGAITYSKIQNVTANSILGRAASTSGVVSTIALAASQLMGRGSTGDLAAITLGTNLSMSGTTLNATGGSGTFAGGTVTADIEYSTASIGTIFKTPFGARYRITMGEDGGMISTLLTMPTPQSFDAVSAGATQVNLSWTAVNATIVAAGTVTYIVDRATDSGFTANLASGIYSSTGTSYSDTGRTASTTYYYRIRATQSGVADSPYGTDNVTTAASGGASEAVQFVDGGGTPKLGVSGVFEFDAGGATGMHSTKRFTGDGYVEGKYNYVTGGSIDLGMNDGTNAFQVMYDGGTGLHVRLNQGADLFSETWNSSMFYGIQRVGTTVKAYKATAANMGGTVTFLHTFSQAATSANPFFEPYTTGVGNQITNAQISGATIIAY